MIHPALLRASVPAGPAMVVGRPLVDRSARGPLEPAKRLFRHVHRWVDSGYRPERHYMRGGRTPGAKSLAAAG